MQTKTKYGPIKYGLIEPAKPEFKPRTLLRVPPSHGSLVASVFRGIYLNNLIDMQGDFSCLPEYPQISFRPATTSESVSLASYKFGEIAKPQILNRTWLQLGWGVKTSEGVFVSPPKDSQGNPITDERILKSRLNNSKKVNGVYLANNDFGFAPYETFNQGIQDSGDFAKGGLARVLEHTEDKTAKNLENISDPESYKSGVDVWDFDSVKKPVLVVPALSSIRGLDYLRLGVSGNDRGGDRLGCAFGIQKTCEANGA